MDAKMVGASSVRHRWKFFRAGGVDQVALDTNAHLAALPQFDQKLWVALSCPTRGLEFDSRTLDLVDTDHDGRIRAPEVLAAVQWVVTVLKNPIEIAQGADGLPLSSINADTPEGCLLLASAKRILAGMGKVDATAITVADTTDTATIVSKMQFNGDGVIPPGSVDDVAAQSVIADIITCIGGETDRNGASGVTQAKVDQFCKELRDYSDWLMKSEQEPLELLPLGEATAAARETLKTVCAKIDDYFSRCRLAAFDSRATAALNRTEAEYLALAAKELSASGSEVSGFPLARVEADKPLPLLEGVNPAWAAALARLYTDVVIRFLPSNNGYLTRDEWGTITGKFAAYENWLAAKPSVSVERLGIERVRQILAGNSREVLTAARNRRT